MATATSVSAFLADAITGIMFILTAIHVCSKRYSLECGSATFVVLVHAFPFIQISSAFRFVFIREHFLTTPLVINSFFFIVLQSNCANGLRLLCVVAISGITAFFLSFLSFVLFGEMDRETYDIWLYV